ncbi:hypothetical protein OROHE_019250 [Orobanche hederae]
MSSGQFNRGKGKAIIGGNPPRRGRGGNNKQANKVWVLLLLFTFLLKWKS